MCKKKKKSIIQVLSHNLVTRVILTRISKSHFINIFGGKEKVLFWNCMKCDTIGVSFVN